MPPAAPELADAALEDARLAYWEDPAGAMAVAARCAERARLTGDVRGLSRALALQGAVSLHRGDLRGAFDAAADAARHAGDDLVARAEVAALDTHLHFFSGSYAESLRRAGDAVALADRHGDLRLRLHARRMACLAVGNIGVEDLSARLDELLALALAARSPWEEAVARNDLAHLRMTEGDHAGAGVLLDEATAAADAAGGPTAFVRGVIGCTRAELRIHQGRAGEALEEAEAAIAHLATARDVNPYLLGMAVLVKVQVLLEVGRVEDARQAGEEALERLGDRVPQARSMILSAVAGALRQAGRAEEAYDALARGADLERAALQEFSELQGGLDRAHLEIEAARHEAGALSAKNAELERVLAELAAAHGELAARTSQLERLQDQLRDQADRDFLTGLHNRRFLARADAEGALVGALSFAVLDLDHFKAVNDSFGHQVGDAVLIRVAELLVGHLRAHDVVVRTGGEEFALLMPGAGAEEATAACERLRAVVAAEPWDDIATRLTVTASIGVVSTRDAGGLAPLTKVADARLYAAKRAGRNRVTAA